MKERQDDLAYVDPARLTVWKTKGKNKSTSTPRRLADILRVIGVEDRQEDL